jgi:hypothetical protein
MGGPRRIPARAGNPEGPHEESGPAAEFSAQVGLVASRARPRGPHQGVHQGGGEILRRRCPSTPWTVPFFRQDAACRRPGPGSILTRGPAFGPQRVPISRMRYPGRRRNLWGGCDLKAGGGCEGRSRASCGGSRDDGETEARALIWNVFLTFRLGPLCSRCCGLQLAG